MIYEMHGRRLMVEFKCGRCGNTVNVPAANFNGGCIDPIEKCAPPEGWMEHSDATPLMCDECAREFERFMRYVVVEEK